MALVKKLILIVGFICIFLIAAEYAQSIRLSFPVLAAVNLVVFAILFALLFLFIIRPSKGTPRIHSLKNSVIKPFPVTKKNINEQEVEKVNEYITHLAHYDPETSLPNQTLFSEILNKTINRAKRHNQILAVMMISIDSFKDVNIVSGENQAEIIIKELGNRFEDTLRKEDVLAKTHDHKFIVLLSDIKKSKFAAIVAEKLLESCRKIIKTNVYEFSLTTSIGISIYPDDGQLSESLIKNANEVLYDIQHSNGNAYRFYNKTIDREAHEFVELESGLRSALNNHELLLYYQPKLHLKKGAITSVEALLRWEHPLLGIITPAKFIPITEETGQFMAIGEWALREACKMNKAWQDEGFEHITTSINLSPKQFHHPDIIQLIDSILKETGLHPNYLELEINENTVMEHSDKAEKILKEMAALGVRISLDHFGTGYTSISYLKRFPLNRLNIDPLFIKGIPQNPDDSAIVGAFISLAHHLGFEVVAQGVETAEQVQYLTQEQCDIVQGYFLSYPLPPDKIKLQFKKIQESVII